MFTDSTAKHVYRSVATVFIIVHTTHGSVFVFLLLAVPFCCRLFCQWNYAYFFAAALNSLLCSIYLFHVAHSVSLNDVFLYFFLFCAYRSANTMRRINRMRIYRSPICNGMFEYPWPCSAVCCLTFIAWRLLVFD